MKTSLGRVAATLAAPLVLAACENGTGITEVINPEFKPKGQVDSCTGTVVRSATELECHTNGIRTDNFRADSTGPATMTIKSYAATDSTFLHSGPCGIVDVNGKKYAVFTSSSEAELLVTQQKASGVGVDTLRWTRLPTGMSMKWDTNRKANVGPTAADTAAACNQAAANGIKELKKSGTYNYSGHEDERKAGMVAAGYDIIRAQPRYDLAKPGERLAANAVQMTRTHESRYIPRRPGLELVRA